MPTIQESKLVRLLRLLRSTPEDEVKDFRRWLESPWCNTNKNVVRLYKLIIPFHPGFEAPVLTREWLSIKMFGSIKDKQTRNLMTLLAKQVDKYLVHNRLKHDKELQHRLLGQVFLDKGALSKGLDLMIQEVQAIQALPVTGAREHLALFRIHRELFEEPSGRLRNIPGDRTLQKMEEALDNYYGLNLAFLLAERRNRSHIFDEPENPHLSEQVRFLQNLAERTGNQVISLYLARLKDTQDFWTLKEQFLKLREQLPYPDQKRLLLLLINEALSELLKGDTRIIPHIFELYRTGVDQKLIFHHGYLTQRTFINVITASDLAGEIDYAQDFAKTYLNALPAKLRPDAHIWARAYLARLQKKYTVSLDLIAQHSFSNFAFSLLGRMLSLKSYFDLFRQDDSYYQFLLNYLESFEKWLRRENILSLEQKTAHLNFLKYVKRLVHLQGEKKHSREMIQSIKEDLSREEAIVSKRWLLETLE